MGIILLYFMAKKNCRKNQEFKDLIKRLLELDVEKRITIEMALNHNFFNKEKNEEYDNSEKIYIETKQKFLGKKRELKREIEILTNINQKINKIFGPKQIIIKSCEITTQKN